MHAPVREPRQYYFGVRGAAERVSGGDKLGLQLAVVVNFPVEHEGIPLLDRDHRLMTGWRQVENRKAPESQGDSDVRIHPGALIIGPPVLKRRCHTRDACRHLTSVFTRRLPKASYATHQPRR